MTVDGCRLLGAHVRRPRLTGGCCFTSSLPHFLTSSLPHFLTSSLPHFLTSSLPHFLTSSLPHFLTSSLPHFLTSSLPRFLANFDGAGPIWLSPAIEAAERNRSSRLRGQRRYLDPESSQVERSTCFRMHKSTYKIGSYDMQAYKRGTEREV